MALGYVVRYLTHNNIITAITNLTRRALGGAHVPPTKLFPRLAVNKTILKPRVTAATAANSYTLDFPDVIKFRVAAHTISEKAIRFRHPDYNPDQAQKLISSSMSRHLSTRNISSKSMHAFLRNLANRQTDKRTQANAFTTSFVRGNYKNLAIANGSRVSCTHNSSRASP